MLIPFFSPDIEEIVYNLYKVLSKYLQVTPSIYRVFYGTEEIK